MSAHTKRLGQLWLLVVGLVLAATLACAGEPSGQTSPAAAATPAPAAGTFKSGMAPMPADQRVPAADMPPGSFDPDPGPSDVVFPHQQIMIRFNHKFHIAQGATCKTCHPGAYTSQSVQDRLLPPGTTCDACHMTDHSDLAKVTPGDDEAGKCVFCHLASEKTAEKAVPIARSNFPRANMVFNHQKHVSRNINCQQCHGAVQDLELATRDQLPRMRGCFKCHQMTDSAARGTAKSECTTCHVRSEARDANAGRMRTMFASGEMKPPRWLRNAAHTPDWIDRHKTVAGNDSQFCGNCHKEDFCTACHDGRVRPRSIHPSDYISMHPIEARQATTKCTSCHQEQSFCLTCHLRVGVAMSSAPGDRMSARFHPPKAIWSDAPRRPGHHGFEAERNLNACVSCHIERDCVTCHGGQGIGGGFNPHSNGFVGGCATQMRRNPRPCFVCHQPGDSVLAQCR